MLCANGRRWKASRVPRAILKSATTLASLRHATCAISSICPTSISFAALRYRDEGLVAFAISSFSFVRRCRYRVRSLSVYDTRLVFYESSPMKASDLPRCSLPSMETMCNASISRPKTPNPCFPHDMHLLTSAKLPNPRAVFSFNHLNHRDSTFAFIQEDKAVQERS